MLKDIQATDEVNIITKGRTTFERIFNFRCVTV